MWGERTSLRRWISFLISSRASLDSTLEGNLVLSIVCELMQAIWTGEELGEGRVDRKRLVEVQLSLTYITFPRVWSEAPEFCAIGGIDFDHNGTRIKRGKSWKIQNRTFLFSECFLLVARSRRHMCYRDTCRSVCVSEMCTSMGP